MKKILCIALISIAACSFKIHASASASASAATISNANKTADQSLGYTAAANS